MSQGTSGVFIFEGSCIKNKTRSCMVILMYPARTTQGLLICWGNERKRSADTKDVSIWVPSTIWPHSLAPELRIRNHRKANLNESIHETICIMKTTFVVLLVWKLEPLRGESWFFDWCSGKLYFQASHKYFDVPV